MRTLPVALGLMCGALSFLSSLSSLWGDDWVQCGSTGKITIKNITERPVIEAEVKDLSEKEFQKAFRLATRYLALAKSPISYPLVLVFPGWNPSPQSPQPTKIYLQMILNSYASLPEPKEKGLRLTALHSGSLVSLSRRGSYESEEWLNDLQKLKTHLTEINLPSSGSPQRMLFHNMDVTPSFWRLSEIQIPIPTLN